MDDLFPESGGLARSVQLQVDELAAAGHDVTVFAPSRGFVAPTRGGAGPLPYWHIPGTPGFMFSLASTPAVAGRVAAEHPLDVVHTQSERGALFLGAMVARRLGVPHIHTFHSNYSGSHPAYPISGIANSLGYLPAVSRILRVAAHAGTPPVRTVAVREPGDARLAATDWRSLAAIAAEVDAYTAPAPYLIDRIDAASGGTLAGRGHAIPSGVAEAFRNARRQRPHEATIRFLSCSRLGPEKRVDAILDAFELAAEDSWELRIVGAGPIEAALRHQASQSTRGHVRFLGHFRDADAIAQEFADADVVVLASDGFDTQGLVLAEAATTSTPILYCDGRLTVGTGPDNALLTGPSAADLAEGMRTLANDPDRRARMSAAAATVAPTLSAATMCGRYVDVYRSAISTL